METKKIRAWRWQYDRNCWKNIIIKWNRTCVKRKSWSLDTRQYIIILSLYHFIVVNAQARKRVYERAKWQTLASIRFLFHWREHPCIANGICGNLFQLVSPIGLAANTPRGSYRQWDQRFSVHVSSYRQCQWRDQPVSPLPLTGHALPPKPTTAFMQIRDPLCKLFENRPIYVKSF